MAETTMRGRDAISGSMGKCYITEGNNRFLLMQVLSVKAKVEKTKTEVSIMGKTGKGNKSTGWKGTGTAKLHYNTSKFREYMKKYMETGEDIYFDMQIVNEDPTSAAGRQSIILINCNVNSIDFGNIDADAEILDEEFDFTFEDVKMPETFKELSGMR
ncbi:MAG: phage tail tube protein [Bacteroidota bacterium]|nr:phage tail tube protein [Bacteroidota bacterium]